ncbi:arylsulfatase [Chroococcus sp. FPU101]|uniref:arylsulfatase B n=1 Tax=Chroococcus sp. FPU101 TaxID=1974212 RepID=UPI001A908EA3|nr:arylsulfatase [Chroococcus sp. FPU101]
MKFRTNSVVLLMVLLVALFLICFKRLPLVLAQQQPSRPHILYIMSDDQGWKDVGFHGSDIKTPNLDRLAQSGARLEQYYAHSMCTPSRAALMTGRYPYRYGLQTAVIPSSGRYGLATDEWLLPQALKEVGYKTAIVGKWHLGHAERKYWPRQRGFDYQYGPLLGEIDYFTHMAHGKIDWYRNNELVNEEGYVTTLLGQEAVKLIEEHEPKTPLFLYLAFTAPHAPYQAPPEYLDQYQTISDPNRRAYAAMITAMDDQIGQVLAALDKRGMRNNTFIFFQSDNGGPRSAKVTGEVDTSGGTIPADNGPFRDGKASLYEGGNRVVALANWQGHIQPGSVIDQPSHIVDMYPTFIGLAGASSEKSKPLDGLNIWPALSGGKTSKRNEIVYNVEPFRAALRQGDWKLVWQVTLPPRVELFNLAHDPSEKTNLADKKPDIVSKLKQQIEVLSRDAVFPPLFLKEAISAVKSVLFTSVSTPDEAEAIENQP